MKIDRKQGGGVGVVGVGWVVVVVGVVVGGGVGGVVVGGGGGGGGGGCGAFRKRVLNNTHEFNMNG